MKDQLNHIGVKIPGQQKYFFLMLRVDRKPCLVFPGTCLSDDESLISLKRLLKTQEGARIIKLVHGWAVLVVWFFKEKFHLLKYAGDFHSSRIQVGGI